MTENLPPSKLSNEDIGDMVRGFGREMPGNLEAKILNRAEATKSHVKPASAATDSGSENTQRKSQSHDQQRSNNKGR